MGLCASIEEGPEPSTMEKEEAAGLDLAGTKVETKVNYNGTFLMSPHAQRLAEMSRDSTRENVESDYELGCIVKEHFGYTDCVARRITRKSSRKAGTAETAVGRATEGLDMCIKTVYLKVEADPRIRDKVYQLQRVTNHQNIVRVNHLYSNERACSVVSQWFDFDRTGVDGGTADLRSYVEDSGSGGHGNMFEADVAVMGYQVARALDHLHVHKYIHANVRPSNILITGFGGTMKVQLADTAMGTLGLFPGRQAFRNFADEGALDSREMEEEVPPDLCRSPDTHKTVTNMLSVKSDMWSLGVCIFWALSQDWPFKSKAAIMRGKPDLESGKFAQRSLESKSMLRELFYTDTVRRISARNCLIHGWFIKQKCSLQCGEVQVRGVAGGDDE